MTNDDHDSIGAFIIFACIFCVIMMGYFYVVFFLTKFIINPILNLKPIKFTDFLFYYFIISLFVNGIMSGFELSHIFNVFLSTVITIVYMHYYFNPGNLVPNE